MSNNKNVVGTSENTVHHNMDPYKHLDKLAKSIDNKSQHKPNDSANGDKTLIDFGKGEYTTRTIGDTTITYTKVDGKPQQAYVTSTTAKVVTIPASFGRRRTNRQKVHVDAKKKPTLYYSEPNWAYGDEDEDFPDISERGAEEYGA